MFKNFILAALIVSVCIVSPVLAKKNKSFSITGSDHYKPKNLKVLKRGWSRGLKSGSPNKRYYPESSGPVFDNGNVLVGTHGGIFYSVSASTGKVNWSYENEEPISSTASVSADKVYFTDLGGRMVCLNKSDGRLVWKQDVGKEMLGRPLVSNNRVYILKGEQEVLAFDPNDGHLVWNRLIRTYVRKITMRGQSSIVADGNHLYLGLADGHLYKLSAADGRTVWDKNLTIPLRSFKDIDASVMLDGNFLYVGGYFGVVYKIDTSSGAIKWGAEIATGVPVAVIDDVVVVSNTDGMIYGVNKEDGKQLWFNDLNGSVISAPVLYQDKIFVSTFKKDAFLLDAHTGNQVQKIGIGDGSINRPIVSGNQVVVLTNSAKLVSLVAN